MRPGETGVECGCVVLYSCFFDAVIDKDSFNPVLRGGFGQELQLLSELAGR